MARSRYTFTEPDQPYFLTCTVVEWLPIFTREEAREILRQAWMHQHRENGLKIYGYVVMENHLHAIAQAEELPILWARFKSFTAHRLIQLLEQEKALTFLRRLTRAHIANRKDRIHQLWQEGSHPQLIQGVEMLRQKLGYIHNNPVKRGYVDVPEDWRWSSARNYVGRAGMIEVYSDWGA